MAIRQFSFDEIFGARKPKIDPAYVGVTIGLDVLQALVAMAQPRSLGERAYKIVGNNAVMLAEQQAEHSTPDANGIIIVDLASEG